MWVVWVFECFDCRHIWSEGHEFTSIEEYREYFNYLKCPRCGSKGVVIIGYAIEDPIPLKE